MESKQNFLKAQAFKVKMLYLNQRAAQLIIRQKPQLMQTRGTQGKKETRLANSLITLSPPQEIKERLK